MIEMDDIKTTVTLYGHRRHMDGLIDALCDIRAVRLVLENSLPPSISTATTLLRIDELICQQEHKIKTIKEVLG